MNQIDFLSILLFLGGLVCNIAVAIIVFVIERRILRAQAKAENDIKTHSDEKLQFEALSLELTNAGNSLSYAVAMAVKRGTPNGEIEVAIAAYEKARRKYNTFLMQKGLERIEQEDS